MMDRIRAFYAVVAEGSVNRAVVRLRITQPALSRQMKALEHHVCGTLLEREASGVKSTALGHALVKTMRPALDTDDAALAEVRRQARGLCPNCASATSSPQRRPCSPRPWRDCAGRIRTSNSSCTTCHPGSRSMAAVG